MTTKRPQASMPTEASVRQVADVVAPFAEELFGGPPPVSFQFWDGSCLVGTNPSAGAVILRSPRALRRALWRPGELGLARAWVEGDLDADGDLFEIIRRCEQPTRSGFAVRERGALRVARIAALGAIAAARLGAIGPPLPAPEPEARLFGRRHSKRRDAAAIRHHYDVGNEFYALVLGPSMTYSCARFQPGEASLEAAQRSKHELICQKLGLGARKGMRLLDVGCGWGSLVLHAAVEHGASAIGITLSPSQAREARRRVEEAGVAEHVEIRLQDYRDLAGETFDAIASVGMFEHVGARRMGTYFARLAALLRPEGRLLNHAISKAGGLTMKGGTFINRYVFPDGELIDVADVVRQMERAGLEVRDIESLREHYVKTLRAWIANLEASWERAVSLAGPARARIWRLYMAASAVRFELNVLGVHQVLGVRTGAGGDSAMPPTRAGWG